LYHPAVSGSGGGRVVRDARGRRVRELDRHGEPVATLRWSGDGPLAAAAVRVPDGSWLTLEPRAAHDARWGVSDLLRHDGAVPLTHSAAIDWASVDAIPPLAEPARLPPGGGTAVLNLVAALAADQGSGPVPYRGPYPTEQLFLALLECFRCVHADEARDPLAAFMAGTLRWAPAPHARAFAPSGVYVQTREQVEKAVWRGRAYYRTDWQIVRRHATHRLHEVGGRVHGSLWALDAPLEDHLTLEPDGTVLAATLPPPPEEGPVPPPAPAVRAGLAAAIVAASAPPLADSLRALVGGLVFEWAPLSGDLAVLAGERARLSLRLRRALAARLAAATTRAERVRLGFAALADLAHGLGDGLRARAQAQLAAASPDVQADALARGPEATGAREIGVAVEALLEDAGQLLA
jgi:hypothetical protein